MKFVQFGDTSYKLSMKLLVDGKFLRSRLENLFCGREIELVPESSKGDEQGSEQEAVFRHSSGAYLFYARHLETEKLEISLPVSVSCYPENKKSAMDKLKRDLSGIVEILEQ